MKSVLSLLAALAVLSFSMASAFAPSNGKSVPMALFAEGDNQKKNVIAKFFDELDAFVDDATNRRLGAGAAFYGKRKSNFYGQADKNRKQSRNVPDPTEDYQGPAKSGYFKWVPDENGQMRPVTRGRRQTNIERNPNFWDKVFDKEDE